MAQILSLIRLVVVLARKIASSFWMGRGTSGAQSKWSAQLPMVQVGKQTKHCHLNSNAMTNLRGETNRLLKVLAAATQMLLSALLAYCMTDLSTTTLVGETRKPVTMPERASATSTFHLACFLAAQLILKLNPNNLQTTQRKNKTTASFKLMAALASSRVGQHALADRSAFEYKRVFHYQSARRAQRLMMPPMPQAGRKRIMRMLAAGTYCFLTWLSRLLKFWFYRLQISRASRCSGVTSSCTRSGQLSCPIVELVRSPQPHFACIHFDSIGGKVNAEATVSRSRRNRRPSDWTGNARAAVAPKCWAQALSLAMPQAVLARKVSMRFWMLRGSEGMRVQVSVRLLVQQVIVYTKNIHLNLKELKNCRGEKNSLRKPLRTPASTVALPLANSITERSRMALVGETQKAATQPASTSFHTCLCFVYNAISYLTYQTMLPTNF